MKRIALGIFCVLLFALSANAQCTTQPGFVCISQEAANRAASVVEKYNAALAVIAAFEVERGANATKDAAKDALIAKLREIGEVDNLIHAKEAEMRKLYEQVIAMYQGVVEKLEKRLNAGKSGFAKFMDAVKTIGYILSGIALGRGL